MEAKKWYATELFSTSSGEVCNYLQSLTNRGVKSEDIKLGNSSFGTVIYYYYTDKIFE